MVLAMALIESSCDKKQSNAGTPPSKPSTQSAQADQNMSAKVSNGGKTFTNDSDSKSYNVSNPEALKDYENQEFQVHLDTGQISWFTRTPTSGSSLKQGPICLESC